ncbi:hypothetical protein DQ04_00541180 [Trypanosoma grayi]|uniref:hypothetical protein n=1 Tax=Trypanosoma grayi TaxID=71804 RepID=UPI0004F4355B|nr:hypothetical protein DQ04_00541180 [Trypanosoma grayi]KEG14286.1 hypothetical protein DQ04_00541180 [Trypanosoma grayi]
MAPKKKLTDVQLLDEKRQQLELLRRQCQAVEHLLMLASEEIRCVDHEKTVLKKRLAELQEQCEAVEQKTDEQVRMMQNMSTTCEEQLRQRHKNLEKTVADAEQNNAAQRHKIEETRRVKGEELQRLKDGVVSLRQELEAKALQYGVQLLDVLLVQE